mmetsp:Transcript_88079/g.170612  ORF Transcript_88079/g.170612 Transcript_88079/m.170612 type:complete len:376 (-) Transcript_88079:210-1337(-)
MMQPSCTQCHKVPLQLWNLGHWDKDDNCPEEGGGGPQVCCKDCADILRRRRIDPVSCNLVVNIMADAPPPPCTASASDENQIVFNTQTVNGSGLTFYARDGQGLPGPGDLVLIVCGDCRSSDGQRVNLGENTTFWVLLKGTPEQGRHPIFNDSAALSSSSSAAASSIERSPSDASKTIIVTAIKPGGDGQQVFSLAKPPTKNACAVQVDVLVPGWKVESFALNLQGRSSPLVLTSVNDPHDKIWWTIPDGASIIANMISMPAPVQVHDLSNLIICIEEVPHVLGDLYATMGATTSKHDVRLAFAPHFVPELQLDEELILTIQGEPGTVHWVTSELLDACATHWMGVNLSRVQAPPSAPKPSQDKNPGNGKKPKTK